MKSEYPESVIDKPFTTKIKKIEKNSPKIKTFFFDFNPRGFRENILPGQFLMIWIPGVDEIPMSVAYIGNDTEIGITVNNIGEATNALHNLNVGDYIGARGPYGTAYEFFRNDLCVIIAGGVGLASVRELIVNSNKHSVHKPIVIIGAKTAEELIYLDEFDKLKDFKYAICTDDGTKGYKGFVTTYFDENIESILNMVKNKSNIVVFSCGPEIMMKKIFESCEKNGLEMQASLERMMRCGFGLCGLCVLDPLGIKVCQDGPIFHSEILRKTNDFGKFKRTFSGEKIRE